MGSGCITSDRIPSLHHAVFGTGSSFRTGPGAERRLLHHANRTLLYLTYCGEGPWDPARQRLFQGSRRHPGGDRGAGIHAA
jgi:hypothetical protein